MMTQKTISWQKRYQESYLQLKNEFDVHVAQWISEKEEIIASAPLANPLLKYDLPGIRRYKSGKLRILYALSAEKPDAWEQPPTSNEIIFLFVDLRKDETYKEALKLLRSQKIT